MPDFSPRPLGRTERDRHLFVDRAAELRTLTNTLRRGVNVLLLGPRGVGKTSLLHRAADELEDGGTHVVVVNGEVAASAGELLALVRRGITNEWRPNESGPPPAQDVAQLRLSTPASPSVVLDELDLLRETVATRGPGVVLVNGIGGGDVAATTFGRLRDDLLHIDVRWCVAADEDARGSLISRPASAFCSTTVQLESLDEPTTLHLLALRDPEHVLDEETRHGPARASAGNARRVLQLAEGALQSSDFADVVERDEDIADRASRLTPSGRRLLEELNAVGPSGPSDEALQVRLGWSRGRIAQVFKELADMGLVTATTKRVGRDRPRRIYEVAR